MTTIKEITHKEITEDVLNILAEAFKHPRLNLILAQAYMKIRESQDVHTFIIYEDDITVGTATVVRELKLSGERQPYIAHVEDVAIHKDYRGFGYGKQLMSHIDDWAKQNACYKIVLYCSNDNRKFYKKCGFYHACNLMRKDIDAKL